MPIKVTRVTVTEDGQNKKDVIRIDDTPGGKVVPKSIEIPVNQAENIGQEIIDKAQ